MKSLQSLVGTVPLSLPVLLRTVRKGVAGTTGQYILAIVIGLIALVGANPTIAAAVPGFSEDSKAVQINEQEVLWFARALYSESKVSEEQLLVAWVIRNRVESDRFPNTFEGVVRERNQFSGLNSNDEQYWANISLDMNDSGPGWDSAVDTAYAVYQAGGTLRPLNDSVWHFYSPVSVSGTPKWAEDVTPTHIVRSKTTGAIRFAFYEKIK